MKVRLVIAKIKGEIENIEYFENYRGVDLFTNSGITYQIIVPSKDFNEEVGQEVSIYTSFQVREDSQVLYGFSDKKDKEFFEQLLSVSGIGPKIAIGVLSMFSVDEVTQLIIAGDHKALSKAPGIGPKGAKKIILDLAGILTVEDEKEQEDSTKAILKELTDALRSLGFKGDELKSMQNKGKEIVEKTPEISIEELLQNVLRGEN